jgi:hypothetical protein
MSQSSRCWLIASQLLALSSGATVMPAVSRSKASNRAACRMSTLAVPTATYLGELGPSGEAELAVRVASAGAKGMGAFAAEAAQPGRWIGSYQGPLISLDEQRDLYSETDPEYLFQITPDLYIDGNLSTHFTRFFNHDQKGNLNFTVSVRSGTLESVPSCGGAAVRCPSKPGLTVRAPGCATHSGQAAGPLRAKGRLMAQMGGCGAAVRGPGVGRRLPIPRLSTPRSRSSASTSSRRRRSRRVPSCASTMAWATGWAARRRLLMAPTPK